MSRGKEHTAEQIVNLLRQVEVGVANGKTLPQACKEMEIVELTYYRWREEYGGLMVDQARRLKELEQENAKHQGIPEALRAVHSNAQVGQRPTGRLPAGQLPGSKRGSPVSPG